MKVILLKFLHPYSGLFQMFLLKIISFINPKSRENRKEIEKEKMEQRKEERKKGRKEKMKKGRNEEKKRKEIEPTKKMEHHTQKIPVRGDSLLPTILIAGILYKICAVISFLQETWL